MKNNILSSVVCSISSINKKRIIPSLLMIFIIMYLLFRNGANIELYNLIFAGVYIYYIGKWAFIES